MLIFADASENFNVLASMGLLSKREHTPVTAVKKTEDRAFMVPDDPEVELAFVFCIVYVNFKLNNLIWTVN